MKQIDLDYLKNLYAGNDGVDISKTNITLSDVITESSETRIKSCSAELQNEFIYNDGKRGKGPAKRITYTLKKTDDGKLYAEVEGIN